MLLIHFKSISPAHSVDTWFKLCLQLPCALLNTCCLPTAAVRRCPSAAANTKTSRRQQLAFTSGARCFSASTREEKLEDAVAIFEIMDADGDGSIGFDELTKEDTQHMKVSRRLGENFGSRELRVIFDLLGC